MNIIGLLRGDLNEKFTRRALKTIKAKFIISESERNHWLAETSFEEIVSNLGKSGYQRDIQDADASDEEIE